MRNKIIAIMGRGPGKGMAALTLQEKLQAKIFTSNALVGDWIEQLDTHRDENSITVIYEFPGQDDIPFFPKDTIVIEVTSPGRRPIWNANYTIENDLTQEFFTRFEILAKEALENAKIQPTIK